MIFDLVALNGGVKYLYKTGEALHKLSFKYGLDGLPVTINNTEDYLEFHLEGHDDYNMFVIIIFGHSEDYANARVDLTGWRKLIATVVNYEDLTSLSGDIRLFVTQDFTSTYPHDQDPDQIWDPIDPASDVRYTKLLKINESDVETVYEFDISDLDGEHYVGFRLLNTEDIHGVHQENYLRIKELKLIN